MAYWDRVTRLVERTMDTRTDIGNAAKADLLRNELAKIDTTDTFYVIVYNDCTGWDKHAFNYKSAKTLVRFRRGMCNCVVYASSTADNLHQNDYNKLKDEVEKIQHNGFGGSMEEKVSRVYDNFQRLHVGFVGLIRMQHNPQIRSTGRWTQGPGWWVEGCYPFSMWDFSGGRNTLVIAGFN